MLNIERIESGPACMDATRTDYDADLAQRQALENEDKLNKVLNGIRKLDLSRADVHQILVTLAARAQACRFGADELEALDIASEAF